MTTAAKHSFINSAPQFNADKFKAYMAHPRNGEKASILWPMLRWRFDEIPKPPVDLKTAPPHNLTDLFCFIPDLLRLGFTESAARRILTVCDINQHRSGSSGRRGKTKYEQRFVKSRTAAEVPA